jgi:hypothetical protein
MLYHLVSVLLNHNFLQNKIGSIQTWTLPKIHLLYFNFNKTCCSYYSCNSYLYIANHREHNSEKGEKYFFVCRCSSFLFVFSAYRFLLCCVDRAGASRSLTGWVNIHFPENSCFLSLGFKSMDFL